jgi:AcrR family transcriptional regulator
MSSHIVRKRHTPDSRVARSTRAVTNALMALIQERAFREITVGDILKRAGVGRATFYAHFRGKEDVLYSSYERLFTALEPMLERDPSRGRLFPVAELLSHVRDQRRLLDALEASGLASDVWALCEQYAVRLIERRMPRPPGLPHVPRRVCARLLAGNAVALMRWSLSDAGTGPPEVDATFHEIARRVLGVRSWA